MQVGPGDVGQVQLPDRADAHLAGSVAGRLEVLEVEDQHVAGVAPVPLHVAPGGRIGLGRGDHLEKAVTEREHRVGDAEDRHVGIAERLPQAERLAQPARHRLQVARRQHRLAESHTGRLGAARSSSPGGYRSPSNGRARGPPAPVGARAGPCGRTRRETWLAWVVSLTMSRFRAPALALGLLALSLAAAAPAAGAAGPTAHTEAASSVSYSSAVLNGSVTNETQGGAYFFQYGTTNKFGLSTPVQPLAAVELTDPHHPGDHRPRVLHHLPLPAGRDGGQRG